jgi:hypothetical protein
VQLQETEVRFDQFYEEHSRELRQVLELRRFEHDFRELQVSFGRKSEEAFRKSFDLTPISFSSPKFQSKFDAHTKVLNEMTEIGDSVTRMNQLMNELKEFEESCQTDLYRADEVISKGKVIMDSNDRCAPKDTVEPKCSELYRITELFNEKLAKRAESLAKARDLMDRVETANEWCSKGIDLLASQRIENVSLPPETAELKLQEIIAFVESAENFQLSSLRDFEESTSLESVIVSQVSFVEIGELNESKTHSTTDNNAIWSIERDN